MRPVDNRTALTAALGGQVPVLFDNLYPSLPQAKEGKLRALAVTTQQRSFQAPEIPTMAVDNPRYLVGAN